jgi:hypothetical protein
MDWLFIAALAGAVIVAAGLTVVLYVVYLTSGFPESERRNPWTQDSR